MIHIQTREYVPLSYSYTRHHMLDNLHINLFYLLIKFFVCNFVFASQSPSSTLSARLNQKSSNGPFARLTCSE